MYLCLCTGSLVRPEVPRSACAGRRVGGRSSGDARRVGASSVGRRRRARRRSWWRPSPLRAAADAPFPRAVVQPSWIDIIVLCRFRATVHFRLRCRASLVALVPSFPLSLDRRRRPLALPLLLSRSRSRPHWHASARLARSPFAADGGTWRIRGPAVPRYARCLPSLNACARRSAAPLELELPPLLAPGLHPA